MNKMIICTNRDISEQELLDYFHNENAKNIPIHHYHSIEIHNREIVNSKYCKYCLMGSKVVHKSLLDKDDVNWERLEKIFYYGDRNL